jgi:hypothetical protein
MRRMHSVRRDAPVSHRPATNVAHEIGPAHGGVLSAGVSDVDHRTGNNIGGGGFVLAHDLFSRVASPSLLSCSSSWRDDGHGVARRTDKWDGRVAAGDWVFKLQQCGDVGARG